MKKKIFLQQIEEKTTYEFTYDEIEDVLKAFYTTVKEDLTYGERIVFPGIGTLYPDIMAARKIPDMATGKAKEIPPKRTVKFQIHKDFKNELNKKKK